MEFCTDRFLDRVLYVSLELEFFMIELYSTVTRLFLDFCVFNYAGCPGFRYRSGGVCICHNGYEEWKGICMKRMYHAYHSHSH